MDISFVIPCYCSEKNLESVVREIKNAMEQRPSFSYEIILVNDNSKDHTEELIDRLCREDDRIFGIHFAKNFGQPNGLLAGFRAAAGDYIMTTDDDGQTPVGMVWDFYDKIQSGYDIVCAKYKQTAQKSGFRRFGTSVNEWMLKNVLGKPEEIGLSSFFMARRYVIREMIRYDKPYPYIAGLELRAAGKIGNIELVQRARLTGSSGYTLKKLLGLWMNGFTAFSILPLRLAFLTGLLCAGIGLLTLLGALIHVLIVPAYAAGTSVIAGLILLQGGLILLILGIIGEYLGRIYMCINNQPQYIIRKTSGQPRDMD